MPRDAAPSRRVFSRTFYPSCFRRLYTKTRTAGDVRHLTLAQRFRRLLQGVNCFCWRKVLLGGAGDHSSWATGVPDPTPCQDVGSCPAQPVAASSPSLAGPGRGRRRCCGLGAARAAKHVQIGTPRLFSLDAMSKEMQSSGLLATQAGNRCNPTALLLPQKAQRRNQPGLLGNDRLLPDGARLSTAAAPQASSFTPSREKPKASLQTSPGFG